MDLYSQFELKKTGYNTQAPRPDIGIIGPHGAFLPTPYLIRRSPATHRTRRLVQSETLTSVHPAVWRNTDR